MPKPEPQRPVRRIPAKSAPRKTVAPVATPPLPPSPPPLAPSRVASKAGTGVWIVTAAVVTAAAALGLGWWLWSGRTGDLAEARARYQARAEKYPEDPENYKKLSEIAEKLGDASASERYYDLYRRAVRSREEGDAETRAKELAALKEALSRTPRSSEAPANAAANASSANVLMNNRDFETRSRSDGPMEVSANADASLRTAVAAYNDGLKEYAAGRIAEAKKKFLEAVKAKADFAKAHARLGRIALEAGEIREALERLQKATQLDPKDDESWVLLGDAFRETKDGVRAEEAYRKATQANPQNASAYYRLGAMRFRERRFPESAELFQKSFSLDPSYAKAALNLGIVRYRLNDFTGSRKAVEAAMAIPSLQKDPAAMAVAYGQLGRIAQSQGDLTKSTDWLRKAVALKKDAGDLFQIGRNLEQLGRAAEARDAYAQAIQEKPDFAEAHYNLGLTFYAQGQWGESLKSFLKATETRADFAQAWIQAARAQTSLGQTDAARASFGKALAIEPRHFGANLELARLEKNRGQLDQAVPLAQTALAGAGSPGERITAYNELGLIYQKFKLYGEAEKAFLDARNLEASHPEVLANLLRLYVEKNDLEKAAGTAEALSKVSPNDLDTIEKWGNLLVKLGKKDEAKAVLGDLIEKHPEYPNKARVQELLQSL